MSPHTGLEARINSIINREVDRLVNEIAWIDSRLLELGESDEDEIEKKLLRILRRHLMHDLYELVGFVWDEDEEKEEQPITATSLELAAIESFY